MEIYHEITSSIDAYYRELKTRNSFFVATLTGTLTPQQLATYIFNLKYTVAQTIPQCKIGAIRSKEMGFAKLHDYFKLKINEEAGHDKWAQEDLENLRNVYQIDIKMNLCKPMIDLVAHNHNIVQKDPRLYLVYMLFAEYFTVHAGPEFLKGIEQACGIPKKHISVLAKHVALDSEHVAEWKHVVEECKVDFTTLHDQAISTFLDVMKLYGNFWEYVGISHTKSGNYAA